MVHDISYHPGLGLSDHVCILSSISCCTDLVQLATPSLTGDSNGNKIESDASKATIFNQFFAGVFVHEGCSNLPSFTIDCSVPSLCEADVSPTVIYSKLRFVVNLLILMVGQL